MTDPTSAIFTAFYGALSPLTYGGSTIGCYTFAPNDAAMPYMILEQINYTDVGPKDRAIFEVTINVRIYDSSNSREATTNGIDTIGNSVINTILTTIGERLAVSGYDTIDVRLDNNLVLPAEVNETGVIFGKIIRFRLILEE